MTEKPKFHSKMIKNGRWTVRVITGNGPESHIGNFATEKRPTNGSRPIRKTGLVKRGSKTDPKRPRDPTSFAGKDHAV